MTSSSECGTCLSHAVLRQAAVVLLGVPCDALCAVQMLIPARDSLLNMNPCAALKIACMEFLSALIQQPAWCEAEENQENIGQIVELLTMHLLHPNEKLADLVRSCQETMPLLCCARCLTTRKGTIG